MVTGKSLKRCARAVQERFNIRYTMALETVRRVLNENPHLQTRHLDEIIGIIENEYEFD